MSGQGAQSIQRGARISGCGQYRYELWRSWGAVDDAPFVLVIGLNPSTADAQADDPTSRRVASFAEQWGFTRVCMANLFAYRATEPRDMKHAPAPIGPDNDATLRRLAVQAALVVAAWGAHGAHRNRDLHVRRMLPNPHVLRLTRGGQPAHPLYLPAHLRPVPWSEAEADARLRAATAPAR